MALREVIDRYFAAWNARDTSALVALFESPDTYAYEDPLSRVAIRPGDLATVVGSLASILPDFQYTVASCTIAGNRAAVEWTLTGTNTAPLKPGINATGHKLHLAGVDLIDAGDSGGLTRVRRHFDQRAMYEQIGMQVIVEPRAQDRATFGYSKRVDSGNLKPPAVLGVTWIRFRDQSELDRIRVHAAHIISDFLAEPGFIGIVTGAAGDRAFTVTAWETEEALERALGRGHLNAKQDFRTGDLSAGVWTSVWKPQHINRLWGKCDACGQPNDQSDDCHTCVSCGAELRERPPYW